MTKVYLLVFAVILTTDSVSSASTLGVTLINVAKSWRNAKEYCENKYEGGRLSSFEDIKSLYYEGHLFPKDISRLWIKGPGELTQWIQLSGCYNSSSLRGQNSLTIYSNDVSTGVCQRGCRHYNFWAYHPSYCFCFDDKFRGIPSRRSLCRSCDSSSEVKGDCGGSTVMSIYERVNINVKSDACNHTQECNCILAQCTKETGNVLQYFNSACGDRHHAVCDNGEKPTDEPSNWNDKFEQCRDKNAYLLSNPLDLKKYLCKSNANTPFWVGIFRVDETPNTTECMQSLIHVGVPVRISTADCKSEFPFACKYDSSTTESVTQRSSTESEIILGAENEDSSMEFTSIITFGMVIGSLIGSASTVVVVLLIIGCLKAMRAIRRPDNSDARESHQIYFGVTEQQRANAVYEGLGGNDYEEPIAEKRL